MNIIQDLQDLNQKLSMSLIDFGIYRSSISGLSMVAKVHTNYRKDLYGIIDSWFEIIEYCYKNESWNKYALEVGDFLISSIEIFPKESYLPHDSDVIRENIYSII